MVDGAEEKGPREGNFQAVGPSLIAVDDSKELWECCEHRKHV